MKNQTRLEKRLILFIAILVMLFIAGFTMRGNYLVMDMWETIKVVCPGDHVTVSGPYEASWNGNEFSYWELDCWIVTTQ